jgi:hypothetical protein
MEMSRIGYDPNQPRDEWGRWTDDPQTDAVLKSMKKGAMLPTKVEDALEKTDAELSQLRYEMIHVHDKNTGAFLGAKTSYSTTMVSFNEYDPKDKKIINSFKGNIVTHNHPYSNLPFSGNDLAMFRNSGTAIGRVVGYDYIYELEPEMGWETFRKLDDFLKVKGEAVAYALDYLGLTKKDLLLVTTSSELVDQFNIVVMGMIAKEYGWQFRVKENPNEHEKRFGFE